MSETAPEAPATTPDAAIDPPPSAQQVAQDVVHDTEQAAHDTATGIEHVIEVDKTDLHPAVSEVLQFFDPSHLPEVLAAIARPFQALAHKLAADLKGSQLTLALHNLLASKDAAVRAKVAETNAAAPSAEGGSAAVEPTSGA